MTSSVSMTCANPREAALIVNEAVDVFLDNHRNQCVSEIRNKLAELYDRRKFMESELSAAERALDEVRSESGFTDLEEHQYPHPAELRLNRLYEVKDNLLLQIAEAETLVDSNDQVNQEPKEQKRNLTALKARLDQAEKLLEEAVENKKKLDAARIEYQKRLPIRDRINSNLNQLKMLIEKYRLLAEDPETAKVMSVGSASVPEK